MPNSFSLLYMIFSIVSNVITSLYFPSSYAQQLQFACFIIFLF